MSAFTFGDHKKRGPARVDKMLKDEEKQLENRKKAAEKRRLEEEGRKANSSCATRK